MVDFDGAVALLGAVARQWLKDAKTNPDELASLAAWLGLRPDELQRRLQRVTRGPAASWQRTCPACGAGLPEQNRGRRGRDRLFCSDACRHRHNARQGDHGAGSA